MLDYLSPDQEYLVDPSIFLKLYMIRRTSDLNTRVAHSDSSLVLIKNVMLHMLDNFNHSDQSTDTFDLINYPFLNAKNNLKYLSNFTDFDAVTKAELDKFSHRIYRPKLNETLKNYGMAHRKLMIPALKLDSVVKNKNCVILMNYNPLYRIICTNNRPISHYNRYRAFLTTALQTSLKYEKQHMLVIPVPDSFTYQRSNILGLIQMGEISSQKLLSTSHFYFFIIDLVALLLDNNSKLSTLNTIDKRHLSALNIMFSNKDKSIIVNLGLLATLAKSKSYIFSFIDNISRISGVDVPITYIEDAAADPNPPGSEGTAAIITDSGNVNPPEPAAVVIPEVNKPITISTAPDITPQITSPVLPEIKSEIKLDTTPEVKPKEPEVKSELIPLSEPTVPLSEKQKNRIEILSSKYKDIKVASGSGVKTIHQILSEEINTEIEASDIQITNSAGIDPTMAKNTVRAFDQQYQIKLLRKDILNSVVSFKDNGLFLTEYTERNEYNSFTRVKHVKVGFQDIKGKKHTVNFKLPMPDEEGYYLVNGVSLIMSKQLVNIPICKISPTRVSLISNYNKTLVDKVQSVRYSLPDYLAKKAPELKIKLIPKHNTYIGIHAPYDYKHLGAVYSSIATPTHSFYFEYSNRYDYFKPQIRIQGVTLIQLEAKYGVLFGKVNSSSTDYLFMDQKNLCTTVNLETNNVVESNKTICDYFGDFETPAEWCDLKILDKNIPIVFILGYRYGLSAILKNLKIQHRFVKKGTRETVLRSNTDISIEFKDGWLVFNRYPLLHSFILAGWLRFPTIKEVNIDDLDTRDTYYKLLADKGMSTNYLKGIDNYFSFFIDHITKEILEEMGEPTTTRALLIRAVDMLINNDNREPSAISNFRVRSAEKIPAMIYNEISRQYANYKNGNFKDVSFSINTEAIFQRLIQDETMTIRENLNPIHAIKEANKITYTGFGGRSSEAFVARDRKYPEDAVGVLGETTTDSGTVGMVGALTCDPKIKNLRGMFHDIRDRKDLNTVNTFTNTTLLMPGSINDD